MRVWRMLVGKIIAIEGLRRDDDNLPFADAERTSRELQRIDGALCRVGIGIERVEGFHRDRSVAKGSASLTPAVARAPLGSKADHLVAVDGRFANTGLEFPHRDHGHELREEQIKQRHHPEARNHKRDLHPGGAIGSPRHREGTCARAWAQ